VRDTGQTFELRPQLRSHELVIGRNTDNSAMRPDVDLEAEGAKQGVSRLHLALWYESRDSAIQAYDLGSANGSYINGQRIHPREIRLLRNQDELRLGRLVLRVRYYHPGDEVPLMKSSS
jgi:pSer/pThr/pTyr-binding forkhead associated (FHA) protein